MAPLAHRVSTTLNKLCKWRRFFVSWQLGMGRGDDPEAKAIADHREATILHRVELSALTQLCISKNLFTIEEFNEQLIVEAEILDKSYQQRFPGFRSDANGLIMTWPAAAHTMRVMNFLP